MSIDLQSPLGQRLTEARLIAVLVIDRVEDAVPLAKALLAGGVRAMELTLRTPVALEALQAVRREVPGMLAGIGTILSPGQVDDVVAAGADFGVAPAVNPEVVNHARLRGLPFGPGVMTPGDVDLSLRLGCHFQVFSRRVLGRIDPPAEHRRALPSPGGEVRAARWNQALQPCHLPRLAPCRRGGRFLVSAAGPHSGRGLGSH
ncbi:MAG: bifunctional 4-hydroxy-2-oxoglutarate aldolase/2-dehydro-3-deoxy-phosphogluconate aldolase [Verrucomicrobiales bacterium]